ncbi:PQQ-binding-like beta-propeller repeat protein [Streptomyces sp. CAU 1734]|uniref:serine/threonine-protein kinase n=1 Tax=Streptomyces sp. CAU 1734 TaxID=3140360 RepID=UPI003261036B
MAGEGGGDGANAARGPDRADGTDSTAETDGTGGANGAGGAEAIPGYRLIALLGEGGMGRVELARSRSGRLVAVKTVHPHLAAEPAFRERFRRELRAARAVRGPFTAAVLDADPEASRPWLATVYCPGPTLTEAVAAHGPLAPGELAGLGAALAEALAAVHRAGLVHRDLKPSNVIVTGDGPAVVDFGIARSAAEETLTGSGDIIGSPGFIAPELLEGTAPAGPAADVFSLGALLAYAATGRPPYGTGPAHQVLYRTLRQPPGLDAVADPEWRGFLGRLLAREPADRPGVDGVLDWCAHRAAAGPWWEGAAVARLIARREEATAALVREAGAAGRSPGGGTGDGDAVPHLGTPAGAEQRNGTRTPPGPGSRTGDGPESGAAAGKRRTGAGPGRLSALSRRRMLRWGGALAVGGGLIRGAIALSGENGDDGPAAPGPSAVPHQRGRALWTQTIGAAEPLRHGGALYLRGAAEITRRDPDDGAVRWSHRGEETAGVEFAGGLVLLLRTGILNQGVTALDAASGRERWQTPLLRRIAGRDPGAPEGDSAFLSVRDGVACLVTCARYGSLWERRAGAGIRWRAYGFDARTGGALWFREGGEAGVDAIHQAGGRIAVATVARPGPPGGPEDAPGTAGGAGRWPLVVLRARDGTVEQEIPDGGARPEAHRGSAGVRHYTAEKEASAVNLATGRTLWRRRLDEADAAVTPVAAGGLVIVSTWAEFSALDARTGRTRWSRTDVTGLAAGVPPPVSGSLVFAAGPEPGSAEPAHRVRPWGVHALDIRTGGLVWAAPLNVVDRASAVGGDGLVHVAAGGVLHTFRLPESRRATPRPEGS